MAPPAPPASSVDPDLTARLEARVADLEREITRLRSEREEPPVLPAAVPAPPPAFEDVPAEAPASAAAPVEDDRIESEVRKVIAEREQAARAARAKQAAEKQAAKDEKFLAKLQAALDLTEYQREELLGHLKTRRMAYGRYKRLAGADGVTEEQKERYRQAITDWVANQDAELTKLLGVDKFERLMEMTTPPKR
jgi:hypothetical protein